MAAPIHPLHDKMASYLEAQACLIPSNTGTGNRMIAAHRRTLKAYIWLYLLGVYFLMRFESTKLRAFGIGMLFPGAGLTTALDLQSMILFPVTLVLFLVSLFMWLGMGALVVPILVWFGSAFLAGTLTRDRFFEPVAFFWAGACPVLILTIWFKDREREARSKKNRERRNDYICAEVLQNQKKAPIPAEPGTRELDLRTLRFVQWAIELGLLPADDWSRHTVIDQFQTAALRYQLYQTVYSLQVYQCHFVPNYSGVVAAACRNALIKAQCKKVNSFWKWECMLGKLNFNDWNPIKKDNIMVTGYIALALALYDGNTRDHCFRKEDCMDFVVTAKKRYKTDFPKIVRAVYDNMNASRFTLYPCEPHWIYTPCNLFAAAGLVAADRVLGTNYSEKLRSRFQKSVEEEFSASDGSILPIRSKITGFSIPGGVGIAGESINSVLCRPYLPHIGSRCWAIGRKEAVTYDENRNLHIFLKHADSVDPGNYKHSEGVSRVLCAHAAAEYGDHQLRDDCLEQLDTLYHPVEATDTGSLYNRGLSTFMQGRALEARMLANRDWFHMITKGVPEHCFLGPLLEEVPFPEVLVAKAWSHDGVGLELVLYNGATPGDFELVFRRLRPESVYTTGEERHFSSDSEGNGRLVQRIDGRTHIWIRLSGST